MMFKTVNFNIFEEDLQEIVYGEKSVSQTEKPVREERKTARLVRTVSEIVIEPIVEKRPERGREKF